MPEFEPVLRQFPDRETLGKAAAQDIAEAMTKRLASQPGVRMIFASAPSQATTLRALAGQPGIDWGRVTAFHMDEYIGLDAAAPQRFGNWLRHRYGSSDRSRCPDRALHRAACRSADRHPVPGHRRQWSPRLQRPARRLRRPRAGKDRQAG
jgi:hypothetical protein